MREVYSYLVEYHLPTRFPSMFKPTGKGMFQNMVTGAIFPLSPPSDPEVCLRTLAETVEEDIFLLKETDTTHVCLAFLCCFPTGFDPSTKLGQDLKGIHDPVPSYDKIGPSMERFFRKLQAGKSVKRVNVSISMKLIEVRVIVDSTVVVNPNTRRPHQHFGKSYQRWRFVCRRRASRLLPGKPPHSVLRSHR